MSNGTIARALAISLSISACVGAHIGCSDAAPTTEPSTTPTSATYYTIVVPETAAIAVGGSLQLRSVAAVRDGTQKLITTAGSWATSDAAVATVDALGVVTGIAPGSANITVSLDGLTATTAVTVGASANASTTYWGAAALPGGAMATLRLTDVDITHRVNGELFLTGGVTLILVGRFDEPTGVIHVAGGGFVLLGTIKDGVVLGALVNPDGQTGSFSAVPATSKAVTAFCGSYTSEGVTSNGNSDGGAITLAISADRTASGASLSQDATAALTFAGQRIGDALSLTSMGARTLTGTVQAGTVSGTFETDGGYSAAFSATTDACP